MFNRCLNLWAGAVSGIAGRQKGIAEPRSFSLVA